MISVRQEAQQKLSSGKNVLLINVGVLDSPELTLIDGLLRLGHSVTVIGYDLDKLPENIKSSSSVARIDLGYRKSGFKKLKQNAESRSVIRGFIDSHGGDYDVIWTTNEITVREIGKRLFGYKHVMQLYELCEYVPLFGRRSMPFHSETTIQIAQAAACVVVPEYNRACIQQVWWGLPRIPKVLPNKPQLENGCLDNADLRADKVFANETRKVVLYQGIFTSERNLVPFAKAMDFLQGEYALYLMGKAYSKQQEDYLREILSQSEHVKYIGYEQAPNHLAYTKRAHIGIMVYVPEKVEYISELNGLYCAPNKLWEYAHAGLPMLSNDLPGLKSLFDLNGMGKVTSLDSKSIAMAIKSIDMEYEAMSKNALSFYKSVNVDEIITSILEQ